MSKLRSHFSIKFQVSGDVKMFYCKKIYLKVNSKKLQTLLRKIKHQMTELLHRRFFKMHPLKIYI
jgi:hypothetical protein